MRLGEWCGVRGARTRAVRLSGPLRLNPLLPLAAICCILIFTVRLVHIAAMCSAPLCPASSVSNHQAVQFNFGNQTPETFSSLGAHRLSVRSATSRWWVRPLSRPRLSRAPVADRRIFFSFNQLLLSLIAPRLMRYQLDLMMHSVVSELFR